MKALRFDRKHRAANLIHNIFGRITHNEAWNPRPSHRAHNDDIGIEFLRELRHQLARPALLEMQLRVQLRVGLHPHRALELVKQCSNAAPVVLLDIVDIFVNALMGDSNPPTAKKAFRRRVPGMDDV